MRLKSIKLAGFKSFVDPTTVHFPGNLCAVVGPNGCGKSNVIDAVRWVMGESSAKNLRGESMTDVIFNGSGGRKPVGQASIELVFDNTDSTLGGEYASYAEISIRRKVTRDGQSNYYLNGNKCRRRDITDIFLGTGLGPRSYAIIEQGMISRLIEAKPDELRVYIEEAAGISRYKERRKDTESRMRRTQENLERLTDIRDELGRQLQRLERQAQAAEKYSEFKREEGLLRAQLQALRWRELDAQVAGRQGLISRQELAIEALVTERSGCDTALEKLRSQYTDDSDRFNEIQGEFYAVGAEVARIEQSMEHARQRARELQEDIAETERNYVESELHLRQDREKLQLWDAELAQLRPQLEEFQGREDTLSHSLQDAEQAMGLWQARWDEFNQRASGPRQQAEVQQSRIQHFEQALRRLAERSHRVEAEYRDLNISPAEDEVALLEEQLAELALTGADKQAELEGLASAIDAARTEYQHTTAELGNCREQVQTLKGRKASLEALQHSALEDHGDERAWLADRQLAGSPRLAEALRVAKGWETAVETVLDGYLQAVCVDSLAGYIEPVGEFGKGELTLVESAAVCRGPQSSSAVPLLDHVSGPAISRLAGVFAAATLDEAMALRPGLGDWESVVTKDGVWLGGNWIRVCRDKNAASGVLRRQQDLELTDSELATLGARLAELGGAQVDCEQALRALESRRETLSRELADHQRHHAELRSRSGAMRMQIEQLAARRGRAEAELEETAQQQRVEQENLAEARQILQGALDDMEQDTSQREALLAQRDTLRSDLDQARQSARHSRDRRHELEMRERSVSAQLQAVGESVARLEVQVARLEERREQLHAALSVQDDPSEELRQQLEERLDRRLAIEKRLAEARRQLEGAEGAMRERETRRQQLEQQIMAQRTELEQTRLAAQELHTRAKTIGEQIAAASFDLQGLLDDLGEGANPQQWEEELERLAARIQRLGAINLAAIEEYKIESERKSYLDTQNTELMEALETLESAIRKIDRETRTRFKETFDTVNSYLQELFPKVFGGGHAYLELTGDDLLDTGVAIMARPPGKKNTTIHLLSGGEKALTAIALVFAIFQLNPAPFCMLDEVDAPLDDANVARYARMVEEMSAQVQFIYITHNKIAMEMAQHLMGVTMHEPGVSRLVTVDVDKAVELAEA